MDAWQQNLLRLESIQEESEVETERSRRRAAEEAEEEEEEQRTFPRDEVLDDDETQDDDVPLGVRRPGWRSRSLSEVKPPSGQNADGRDVSASDKSESAEDEEETTVAPVQRPASGRRRKDRTAKSVQDALFPPWLVALMVNIEEATMHQLLVE